MSEPYSLHLGDCLESLKRMPDNSVDAVVTDPPYGLSDHKPAEVIACLSAWIAGETYQPKGKGFMGKSWDAWVPGPEVWRECLRVLKPGGHLLAFAGTRSMDLMSMAVRLSGFELRDSIGYANDGGGAPVMAWTFGSGFPKSMDVSKAIDKAAGAEREVVGESPWASRGGAGLARSIFNDDNWQSDGDAVTSPATEAARQWQGWGTALKPAWEPIILARKPMGQTVAANVIQHGTGALNIDGCRVESGGEHMVKGTVTKKTTVAGDTREGAALGMYGAGASFTPTNHEGGRWPANLITDGSDEVLAGFPMTGKSTGGGRKNGDKFGGGYAPTGDDAIGYGDTGSAARFFYCAKASKRDRDDGLEGFDVKPCGPMEDDNYDIKTGSGASRDTRRANTHPTVKPTNLMRYLCRLVTPPGGVLMDLFMGSGSTGKAAMLEGFRFIGCERDPEYLEIARARIEHARQSVAHKPEEPTPQLGLFDAA